MTDHAHADAHGAGHHGHAEQNWFLKYFWSTDHKIIAMQYMFTGMLMALIGGFMAYVFRMQIAYPGMNVPFFGHVSKPGSPHCCGRTYLASGRVDEAKARAGTLVDALLPLARAGIAIVGLEPSCLLTLRDETLVMGLGEGAEVVAKQALTFEEFIAREAKAGRLRTQVKRYYEEKDAEAGKLYRQWDTLYGEVEGEELFEQWAKDPELVPFLVPYFAAFAKDIANDDPGVSNLPSDEAFDRYLQMARENRNQKLEEYRALEAKLSPPDFVVEFAKTREKANLLFGIYDAYVRKNTPDYVSIARNESKEISNQLTQLWPNWEKVEESAELKAREESRIHGSALNQPFKSWALIAINVVFVAGLVLIIAWRRWRGQRKM